jgi:hypothetical protein
MAAHRLEGIQLEKALAGVALLVLLHVKRHDQAVLVPGQ